MTFEIGMMIGATAFFLPIILSISRQLKVSPSRLLMPLAFSLASSVTLIRYIDKPGDQRFAGVWYW